MRVALIILALSFPLAASAQRGLELNSAQANDFLGRSIAAMEALPVQAPAYLVPDHYDVMIRYANGARDIYARPRYSFVAIDARNLPADRCMMVYRWRSAGIGQCRWNVGPWRHGHMMVVPIPMDSNGEQWVGARLVGVSAPVVVQQPLSALPVMTVMELESIR